MKSFSNLEQVKKAMDVLEESNWKYCLNHCPNNFWYSRPDSESKFKKYGNGFRYRLFLSPEKPFLGVFNRFHRANGTYNFSIIEESTLTESVIPILEELAKLKDPGIKFTVNDEVVSPLVNKRKLDVDKLVWIIEQVFSDEFNTKNNISKNQIQKTLEALKVKPIGKNMPLNNFRLEEIRNDLRIVLMINPKTLEVKLCYSYWEFERNGSKYRGMESPASDFFYHYFNTNSFWRFVSRNIVQLATKRDFSWVNENCNIDDFSITHHTDGMRMESPFGIAISSGKAQMKFVDELLIFMVLNFGDDDFLYHEINREKEFFSQIVSELGEKKKKLNYYDGLRSYSTPQFDIYVRFAPSIIANQMYFKTSVHIYPYHNIHYSERVNKGWGEHRMVGFWEIK